MIRFWRVVFVCIYTVLPDVWRDYSHLWEVDPWDRDSSSTADQCTHHQPTHCTSTQSTRDYHHGNQYKRYHICRGTTTKGM